MSTVTAKLTPMMQQWHSCKSQVKDALLLFRLGDFYEAFYEDAVLLSELLDITLTKRQDVPMAGIPVHTLEQYLEKLMAHKCLVAIAEQVEDPKEAKGIVERKVVEVISPATYLPSNREAESRHNYFACIAEENGVIGAAFCDISTGSLSTFEVENEEMLLSELLKKNPTEILISYNFKIYNPRIVRALEEDLLARVIVKEDKFYNYSLSTEYLSSHFEVQTLDGFGLKTQKMSTLSLGTLLYYLKEEMQMKLNHIRSIKRENIDSFLYLDHTTLSHLDIQSGKGKKEAFTLVKLMDHTETAMGYRLLLSWILHPLIELSPIVERQKAISALINSPSLEAIKRSLSMIKDLERISTKIENKKVKPKELIQYKLSLSVIPSLKKLIPFLPFADKLDFPLEVLEMLQDSLEEVPPLKIGEGRLFKKGFNQRLDELLDKKEHSHQFLISYQNRLREELDSKTLKVSFTRAFGYYIEVSKGQSHKLEGRFEKRQTLVNAERYISKELLEFETQILQAESHSNELEALLYDNLLDVLSSYTKIFFTVSEAIAELDALFSLATLAKKENYVCPIMDNSSTLSIIEGRHPMIEKALSSPFIPNDTYLSSQEKMMIITGPNMAGKSTYIRQVALIVLIAQIGSFVPAKSAHIGIIHKLFTRIGASDDLTRGLSTFMVEMSETASILNQKCEKSLIILDEIGRGTSTFDGIAIAEAVASYLIAPLENAPKTLFATHYFELNALEKKLPGIANYRVAVDETGNDVVFLHKIVKGGADKSYGIHVAKLAGLPKEVIEHASCILKNYEL